MKLLLPTNIPIDLDLPERARTQVELIPYDVREPIPAEHRDAELLVAWLNPPDRIDAWREELPHLRWIQSMWAGPDALLKASLGDQIIITGGSGLHDGPVAEHALALILAAARRLDIAVEAKREARWATELTGNQLLKRTGFTAIEGSTFAIWGFGGIGQHLARHLRALGGQVLGVATTAGERNGFEVVTADDLAERLPQVDVLVNILPSKENTAGVVDARIFDALPTHAWFINVGRGSTVDEGALLQALIGGSIAGAALDVFTTEPLPAESALWSAPNLLITPHSAGGRPQRPGELIAKNLQRLLDGEELIGVAT